MHQNNFDECQINYFIQCVFINKTNYENTFTKNEQRCACLVEVTDWIFVWNKGTVSNPTNTAYNFCFYFIFSTVCRALHHLQLNSQSSFLEVTYTLQNNISQQTVSTNKEHQKNMNNWILFILKGNYPWDINFLHSRWMALVHVSPIMAHYLVS